MSDDRLAELRELERLAILRDHAALERAVHGVLEAAATAGRELEAFRQAMTEAARRAQPAMQQLADGAWHALGMYRDARRVITYVDGVKVHDTGDLAPPRVREHGAPRHVRQPAPFWTTNPTRERRRRG